MMIKKILFPLVLLFTFTMTGICQDGTWAVSKIPEMLLKNADAVIRLEEIRFEVDGLKKAVLVNHYVITILNENADDWAVYHDYYDEMQSVESVDGVLYDAAGKALKKMKTKDLVDISGVEESNLIDDNRVKLHNFYYKVYPYTVEYTSEIHHKSTLFFPAWVPQEHQKLSVEQSSFSLACPTDYQFRYKAFNYTGEPVISQEKNSKVATWSAKNLPAIEKEPFCPLWHELTTMVIFGPTEFQVDDYHGNMASWQDFGKFVYSLKQDRDQLPDNIKQNIHQLIDGVSSTPEKISKLYEYMQKNTRYISIQLGIGGWQPFDAKYVATKGYGDCKALTNYMYSILKEAGINSCYTLIHAGTNEGYITDDFPSQQFNHVILCVPMSKDTLWLECTSQTLPAGYLGDFTCDRYALLVDENGGKLIRTPKYGLNENLELRHIVATLDDDATLELKAHSVYDGLQQDLYHDLIHGLSRDKLKEFLHGQLDFATYDISSFDYKESRSALPAVEESLDIIVSNYATITGKRLFIVPNVMTRTHRKLTADTSRKYDIVMPSEWHDIDSVEINLPPGYIAESVPEDISVTSKWGKYSSSVKMNGGKLMYYRSMEQYSGRFPPKDYPDLVKFYDAIYKADRNKVVLVRNQ